MTDAAESDLTKFLIYSCISFVRTTTNQEEKKKRGLNQEETQDFWDIL